MAPTEPPRIRWFSPWDLLPLAVAVILMLALPSLLKGLPDPLPTHFDGMGRPNGWTSHRTLPFLALGLAAFVWGLLLVLGRAFVGTEQDPDGRKSAATAPLRGLLGGGIQILTLSEVAIPRFGLGIIWAFLALFVATLLLGVWLMVRALKRSGVDAGNPEHYRWGLFYVNPEDPAIWVPKRFGLGWTLNFAHAASWWMLLLLLSPVLAVVVMGLLKAS